MRAGERGEQLEATQNLRERVAPRDFREALALQRVDRDVEPIDARRNERLGVAFEQIAIRRQRKLVEARDRREHLDQPWEVAAHERLAAGQPDGAHAELHEHADEPRDLLEAQQLLAFEPLESLRRHAVAAAEVAAVRYRKAQVADLARMPVAQLLALHHHLSVAPEPPGAIVKCAAASVLSR